MSDLIQHPKTPDDFKTDVKLFESLGEQTTIGNGNQQKLIVNQLHDYLATLTRDERKQFYASYEQTQNDPQTKRFQLFNIATGEVTKDSSGQQTGVDFNPTLFASLIGASVRLPLHKQHIDQ